MSAPPRAGRRLATLLIALFVGACASQHPATQVTVLIDAQPHVRGLATQLVVRVTGGHDGETFLDASDPIVRSVPLGWPFDVTVTPAGNDATRLFELEATAYDAGHQLVSQARLRGGYVRGDARHVTITLEDACVGISCAMGLTCRNGQCVPIGSTLGDAGMPDGGGDAGPVRCTTNAQCDDDNVCNGFESCVNGSCVAGPRLDCDDHVGCTADSCDGRQCVHTPDATRCTAEPGGTCDPTFDCQYGTCTPSNCASTGCQTARCSGNVCMRTFACATGQTCCGTSCVPAGCEDGLPCTTDFCGSGGTCEHTVFSGPCDDHDLCTGVGTCGNDGTCTPGVRISCDDANGCTTDACDPATGCTNLANSVACDDHNACTVGDSCGGGSCVSGTPAPCDDGVACTDDSCDASRGCQHVPNDSRCGGAGAHCSATAGCQVTGTCTPANCQPTPGTCETAVCSTDLTMCLRGTRCSSGQMCCGSACVPDLCTDGNPCTDDVCNGMTSTCTHTAAVRGCDDGDACTTPDRCMGGTCVGTPLPCDDFQECTADSCSAGACVHTPLDGTFCTGASGCSTEGMCSGGFCFSGLSCGGGMHCCFSSCVPIGDPCFM